MTCTNCGSVLLEDVKFCGECGQVVKQEDQVFNANQESEVLETYVFKQTTSLGRMIIKEKGTAIEMRTNAMTYASQSVSLIFIKDPYSEKDVKYSEINNATLKGTIDKSDLLFGVIFGVIGVAMPLLWILSAFLILSCLGKVLKIYTASGELVIHMNGFGYKSKLRNFLVQLKQKSPQIPTIEV